MRELVVRRVRPALKELVLEASRALAQLDAARLEELALSCQALNRELAGPNMDSGRTLASQAREASGDMAVFARVLEVTRSNLNVMSRLRELHRDRLEYREPQIGPGWSWKPGESGHGNN